VQRVQLEHQRHGSVLSVPVVCLVHVAVLLIIRRSWVRAPPAPPAVLPFWIMVPWTDVGDPVYRHVVARGPAGHIEPLPSGSWRVKVHAGTDPLTGREIQFRKTCKTEQAAQIELGRLLAQAARDASPTRPSPWRSCSTSTCRQPGGTCRPGRATSVHPPDHQARSRLPRKQFQSANLPVRKVIRGPEVQGAPYTARLTRPPGDPSVLPPVSRLAS
jgi:hypothetical protein